MAARLVLAGALLGAACLGWCDSITVKGQQYNDVLIHTSSNFYYVTLPDAGRVMTVPLADVDPAAVSINNEVTYRSALKATYEANRQNPKDRSYSSLDRSQVAADAQAALDAANDAQFSSPVTAEAPEGGAVAAGGGLGVSAAQLQAAVKGAGVTMAQQGMQAGHPKIFGQSANGQIQVDAYGAEENLIHISFVVTGSDIGQIQAAFMQVGSVLQQAAPWAPEWIMANFAEIQTSGSIDATQQNVHLSVIGGASGANVSLTITLESVG